MKQIKKRTKQKLDLLSILAILVVARVSCPALSNIPIFSMAFTFIYGAAFVLLYLTTAGKIKKNDFYLMLSAVLYTVYVMIRGYAAGRGLFAREAFNAYIIVFLTVIYVWVKDRPLATKILVSKFIIASLIFNYVYSIIVLIQDPDASRAAASTDVLEASPYDVLNAVGGFDAVYGGISVVLLLLGMRRIMKQEAMKNRLSFLVLALSLVFIVMAAYGTALVLLIISLAIFGMKKSKGFTALLIPVALLLFVFHEQVGQGIINMSEHFSYSETLGEKLKDAGEMLKTFETAGTYAGEGGRAARMMWSLNAFWNHPIFGGLGIAGSKVGGHSELLDMLGNFGITGIILVSLYFIQLYNVVRTQLIYKEIRSCWNVIIVMFVISAVLNPSLYSLQMMPLILMVPLAPSYIEWCKK